MDGLLSAKHVSSFEQILKAYAESGSPLRNAIDGGAGSGSTSEQMVTHLAESFLVHAFELPPTYELVSVDVRIDRVVDLATRGGRNTARVSVEDLVAPPKPIVEEREGLVGTRYDVTWELGRLAWARGAGGLLVPSAALPAQRVLVVLERTGHRIAIRDRQPIRTDPRMRRLQGPRPQ